MRVAVVGSGIAGLAAAYRLRENAHVTMFESGEHFGGHSNTIDICLPSQGAAGRSVAGSKDCAVDTGFLVFNQRTYPGLTTLFAKLGVETAKSEMSFSVQVPHVARGPALEWSGTSIAAVFAQRRNLIDPRFLRMLADLLRFNALCNRMQSAGHEADLNQPLAEFLLHHRFSAAFRDWYLLPMLGCIWSCPTDQMLQFPVATMIRFCNNHGLTQITGRPQWLTVAGGSRKYVDLLIGCLPDKRLRAPVRRIERIANGVRVATDSTDECFDAIVVATHSDQALELLRDASTAEREVLGSIRYQRNRAVLHTDTSVLPTRRRAWAAWNYESAGGGPNASRGVCLHYLINRLQPLPVEQPVLVSLNPLRPIDRSRIHGEFDYAHPVFDLKAIRAQGRIKELQGRRRTWFAGAWTGYGFHEDGLNSGVAAAEALLRAVDSRASAQSVVATSTEALA